MTEPQQPAAPLEVADPEPALPEIEALVEPSATAGIEVEDTAVDGTDEPTEASAEANAQAETEAEPELPLEAAAEDAPAETEAEPELPLEAAAEADTPTDAEPEPDAEGEAAVPVEAPPPGPRTAGRMVADALRAAGVRYAFTVPGESFLGVLDALGDVGIRVVATRHEGAAAFMAEAYGQLTGRPAACLGTRAVGAANMAIGIHTAKQDSTPLFAIVGQVDRELRGREAFQEVDQTNSFGQLAKWTAEPRSAD